MYGISLRHWEVPDSERKGFSKLSEERDLCRKEDHLSFTSETEFSENSEIKFRSTPSQNQATKTFSSRESSPFDDSSGPLDAHYVEDENEKKLPLKYERKIYSMGSNQHEFKPKRDDVFQVTGKGTRLMKSLNFPTVIVKCLTGNLDKSRVYFAILEIGEELKSEIPALMFSSPYAHKKTRFAEFLPFGLVECTKSVCLTPILQRKRYKRVFHRGFSFKIKSLIPGRTVDGSGEYSWNRYDLTQEDMLNMPKEIINLDIKQMSLLTTNRILPVKNRKKRLRRRKINMQGDTPPSVSLENMEIPWRKADSPPQLSSTNIELSGLDRMGGCNVSDSFKSIKMDKDFKVGSGTIDSITYYDELDKFWCVSELT